MKPKQRKFKGFKRPPLRWQKKQNSTLRDSLRFGETDLEANRRGEITKSQIRRLRGIRRISLLEMIVYVGLLLMLAWFFVGVPHEANIVGIVVFLVMGLSVVWALALVIREITYFVNLSRDLQAPQINTITGAGKLVIDLLHGRPVHMTYLVIGDHWFNVRRHNHYFRLNPSVAFSEGTCYTVFYVPNSRTLVSAEISRDDDIETLLERSVITKGSG